MALVSTQPPVQWVSEALSSGVKYLGHESYHCPPSVGKVKRVWSLVKNRNSFTFIVTFLSIFQGNNLHCNNMIWCYHKGV
jgi:hypothetical protein